MNRTAHRGRVLHCLRDPLHGDADAVEYFADGLLVVDADGRVGDVGPYADLKHRLSSEMPVVDHQQRLLVPGFIDTHVHFPQVDVVARYGTQLLEWLERYTFPAEIKCSDPDYVGQIAEQFIRELLRNGTTTALVFATTHPHSAEAFFEACVPHRLRMICGKVLMDRHAPDALCDGPDKGYSESARLIEQWHGSDRLGYAVTPRFAPTSTFEQLERAGDLLRRFPGVHMHTHLSENPAECRWVAELFPQCRDYLDVYEQSGLLGERSVFAHGIHLHEREWRALAASNAAISHCPCSNLFIGSGLYDLQTADDHGVKTGLGSDIGGGDSFSMLRVCNEAYKVQQLQGRNLHPFRMLYLATLGGARSLGLDDCIGNFQAGKEADFVVLDPGATPLMGLRTRDSESLEDLLFALLMLGDDRAVASTYVMGEPVHARQD